MKRPEKWYLNSHQIEFPTDFATYVDQLEKYCDYLEDQLEFYEGDEEGGCDATESDIY